MTEEIPRELIAQSQEVLSPKNEIIDSSAIEQRLMDSMKPAQTEAESLLNWIEGKLKDGNVIYASDLEKNPLFEKRRDGSWQLHIIAQPMKKQVESQIVSV